MKIVFMGTPEFSVPCLQRLIEKHDVLAVVTQPDKPKGRGKEMSLSPCKEVALAHGILCLQPTRVRGDEAFLGTLKMLQPDLIVVVAFGQILPQTVLGLPKYGCINVHASLLPTLRGAAPIHHAIITGMTETGVTTMQMDVGLDTGDMLLVGTVPIRKDDTASTLHDALKVIGAEVLIETIDKLEAGTLKPMKQDDTASTYAGMLTKEMGHIDWAHKAEDIVNLVRGLNPWPSAYTFHQDNMMKIWRCEAISGYEQIGQVGTIVDIVKKKGFVVRCKDGAILVLDVQMQGKKRMACDDFMRGYEIEIGDIVS